MTLKYEAILAIDYAFMLSQSLPQEFVSCREEEKSVPPRMPENSRHLIKRPCEGVFFCHY